MDGELSVSSEPGKTLETRQVSPVWNLGSVETSKFCWTESALCRTCVPTDWLILKSGFWTETSDVVKMLRTFTLLLPLLAFARAASVMSLNGDGWTLTSPQYPRVSVPATVPSQQYLDLMKANAITDPLYGLGELDTSWVGFSNWTYTSDVITDL